MIKNILPGFFLLLGFSGWGQNVPTVVSSTVDTLCYGSYDEVFLTVVVEDLDGDSTYITNIMEVYGYLDGGSGYTVTSLNYSPGATQTTFEIKGSTSWSIPTGLYMETVNFDVVGNATNDGGAGFETINNIPIYGDIPVTFDISSLQFCSTDNPVDISSYATPAGGIFSWGIDEIVETNGSFNIQSYLNEVNDGVSYEYTNAAGCVGFGFSQVTILTSPTLNSIVNNSTCGNANGDATVTITGNNPPFDVYWTTGFSDAGVSSTSFVNNLSSGTYYANVYDNVGCHAQIPVQVSDVDLTVTENITDQTCPGTGDGAIDITISGGTPDYILWSNGQTTEDISGLQGGEYTVTIHTSNNCQAFKTYYVSNPAPLGIDVISINGEDCATGQTNSLIDITTTGGSGSYMWDWDSGTATTEDFTNPGVGIHTCVVTDQTTGCSWSWTANVPDYGAPYVWVDEVVQTDCNLNNGSIDATVMQNVAPIASIQWNTGQTTEDITGLDAGQYIITATDVNGCFRQEKVTVGYNLPYQPSICLLTVDTTFTYNQVIWEKDAVQSVEGFRVYRETQTQGVYEMVADRPYALESTFIDNSASPMDRSWRYYLTTYDACGNESFPSFVHKTIHIVATTPGGGTYNVSWDKYEGINYNDVDLFRFDNTNGWQNVGTYNTTQLNTTDTPPVTAGIDYIVSFNLASPCTSSKAQDYNNSRSNNSSATFEGGGSTTSIMDEEVGEISFYPNPTNGILNVYIENPELFEYVEVRDINGALVYSANVNSSQSSIEMSDFSDGIYFVRLISGEKTVNQKIIKR
ncbi:MAG: T9SS type A sorting domain-containing protein [Crocinitomicaceae bacterium]|nr:T9SS type A sorting domain-containing protein [Crocinitomicaceae bacterium]